MIRQLFPMFRIGHKLALEISKGTLGIIPFPHCSSIKLHATVGCVNPPIVKEVISMLKLASPDTTIQ